MYDTFNEVGEWPKEKLSQKMKDIGSNEDMLENVLQNIAGFLVENKDVRDLVFITFFEGEDLKKMIQKHIGVNYNNTLHYRHVDTVHTITSCMLYDGLGKLFQGIYPAVRITKPEFVLYWSVGAANGAFADIIANYRKKPKAVGDT
jgi:hypothetical protein